MQAVCGIVRRKGRVLMCKRAAGVLFPGFWELPTEVLDENQTIEDALENAFFDRLMAIPRKIRWVGAVDFSYGEGGRLWACDVELCKNFVCLNGYDDFRWVKPQNLKRFRVLKPFMTFLKDY